MKAFCLLLILALTFSSPLAAAPAERVTPAGEVVVVLSEEFLNALLVAVASRPAPPSFPLAKGGEGKQCESRVQLLPEAQGTRTSVRFADGRITAPVAFRGSYEAPLVGCLRFEGWADTAFQLEFNRDRQVLGARVTVRDLKLRNIPTSLLGGGLTGLVQDAIDDRVNPVEILRAEQLGARIPVTRTDELRLRILYEIVLPD